MTTPMATSTQIMFDDPLTYSGTGGDCQQHGLLIDTPDGENLFFMPYNSRELGNCLIEFPIDKIDELIEALNKIKKAL